MGPDVRAWNGSPLATADASDFLVLKVGLNKPKVNGGHGEGWTLTPTKGRVTPEGCSSHKGGPGAGKRSLLGTPSHPRATWWWWWGEQESPRQGHRALGLPLDGPSCGGGTWPDISRCVSRALLAGLRAKKGLLVEVMFPVVMWTWVQRYALDTEHDRQREGSTCIRFSCKRAAESQN